MSALGKYEIVQDFGDNGKATIMWFIVGDNTNVNAVLNPDFFNEDTLIESLYMFSRVFAAMGNGMENSYRELAEIGDEDEAHDNSSDTE